MGDARATHLRRLRRSRRSARGWSVRAGLLTGATAVLVPYSGLGLIDAFWAAAAGGSIVVAAWRWVDHRELAAQPVPEPVDPAVAGRVARERLISAVRSLPVGGTAIDEVKRASAQMKLHGLAVAKPWRRLDRASATLHGLAGRLGGPAESAVLEAAVAERSLRDLAQRTASVERAIKVAPESARESLKDAHGALVTQLDDGVSAYEQLVAAAAGYVAEDGRTVTESPAVGRLADATEMLRGIALGLAELRGDPRAA